MTLLDIADLSVGWPGLPPVLQGVNFTLDQGARVGLVGPNGTGKSSLFLTLAGVLEPLAGDIRLMGQKVRMGQFQPEVSLVFQHAEDQLFCPTLAEDVAFGARNMGMPEPEIASAVARALSVCGLSGLDDRPLHQLSGGEKRRACLAGAFIMNPSLMLLDEPSSGLDMRNRRRLIALLADLHSAMLIASHDLELVLELCPRVILIDAGGMRADGPAAQVLGDSAMMQACGQEVPHSLT